MAEHTDQTLKKLEQHDTVQKYLVHSDESAEEVIIAGVSNEYGVENHIARHASQASGGFLNAMQTDVVQPARAAVAANEIHDENESPSSRPRSISVSRFFPNLKSPREPNVKAHRKTQSENIAGQTATTNIESRTPPRRNRSAVNSLSLKTERGQQTDQGSEIKKTQWQEPEKTGKPIRTAVFDRSRLDHQLIVALKDDDSTHRKFLPNGDLDRLVTQELVNRELSRSKKEYFATKILQRPWLSSNKYVRVEPSMEHEHIRHGQVGFPEGTATQPDVPCYRKIFAVLVFMGRQRKIKAFVKERVCDRDLPLEVENFQLRRRGDAQSVLKCLKEPSDIEQFVTCQWWVLARTFNKLDDGTHPCFKAAVNEVLPFTRWENTRRWGASGKVYKAEIHPDHHEFNKQEAPNNVVAVKKICAYNPEASHELNVLRNLRKQQHLHHHLLPLVAAYKQHDCLFLILPWAEADLNQYWKMNDPTSLGKSAELSTWLKQQCYGIAEAVSRIHRYDTTSGTMMLSSDTSLEPNPKSAQRHPQSNQSPDPPNRKTLFGRHGDIKPANILWFPGKRSDRCFGTLKLSDFGTTHFSDGQRNSMQDNYTVPYSRSYQSPECRLPDGQISSQCDVWAMGCVFLEFVCWYVGGYELLNKFEHERLLAGGLEGSSFFSFKPEDNPQSDALRLKAPVIKMIETLQESFQVESALNRPLRDVLRTVKDDMLVISYDGAYGGNRLRGTEQPTPLNFLGVQQPTRHRRRSAGNIARELGSVPESPKEKL